MKTKLNVNLSESQENSYNEEVEPPELVKQFNLKDKIEKKKNRCEEISKSDWNDWKWQLSNSIDSLEKLSRVIELTELEKRDFSNIKGKVPLRITPYYLSLIDKTNPNDPLRKTMIPSILETMESVGEEEDPLGEAGHTAVEGIVHRYPDRVLFLITDFCSAYCRYCTRSRMVGKHGAASFDRIDRGIKYIKNNPQIRDVLLSGGDPLTLPTKTLEYILKELKKIEHVEMIRIGTKVPAVLPQRINKRLVSMLKEYHPIYLSIHFTHPNELTPETAKACAMLANAGIPLGSQTVLLKGINDNIETMRKLMTGLLKIRVRPYYLYQCDPIKGSSHFRTSVEKGLEIIKGLRGHITGYGVPNYVIDAPQGGGKIPLLPQYVIKQEGIDLILRNYENEIFKYPNIMEYEEGRGENIL